MLSQIKCMQQNETNNRETGLCFKHMNIQIHIQNIYLFYKSCNSLWPIFRIISLVYHFCIIVSPPMSFPIQAVEFSFSFHVLPSAISFSAQEILWLIFHGWSSFFSVSKLLAAPLLIDGTADVEGAYSLCINYSNLVIPLSSEKRERC